MNRVYKVIYNKGKNSCSVVSEMAKNRGKVSSCRNKVVLAAMVLSLLSAGGLAYAQDPATPAPEPKAVVPYFSVNANDSANPAGTNWNSDGAKGVAAIAVGPRAGAQGDYGTAVGSYAQAGGAQSSAFGVAANASGIAATAAGTNAVAGEMSAAAFGAAANAGGVAATAIGANANAAGASAAATGAFANAAGEASSAFGLRAQAKSNESVAVGAFAEADKLAAAIGSQAKAIGQQSVAVGGRAEAQAVGSLALGSLASATQKGGVALGVNSLADRQARVWGFDAAAGNAMNEDTLLGEQKAERAQAIEKLTGLRGELQQLQTQYVESIKNDPAGPDGKPILSDETKQIQENLKTKTDEFNAQFKLVNGYVNAWQSIDGAVSVGNADLGVTRQITGVAAGTEDTDAVNVAQIKAITKQMEEQATHYFSVNSDDSAEPADTNWNNDGAKGLAAVAVGPRAGAQGDYGTAVGSYAQAGGEQSSAFGVAANASGVAATAAGTNAKAMGTAATAVGSAAVANGEIAAAFGSAANATGVAATAAGSNAVANGKIASAFGSAANATGVAATAAGSNAVANGAGASAFGSAANAAADYSLAIGTMANATQKHGVALGVGSLADRAAGATGYLAGDATSEAWKATTAALAVGNEEKGFTRQITGVAAGTEDTDAVNVVQLKKLASNVNEQMTGLDTRITTNTENITANTENITVLNGRVDRLDTRVDRIGAGAAALAGLHPLDYDPENKWDFAASYGNYNGANAVAIGAFYRPTENRMFSVGGSFGGGENMLNVGFSMKVGQGTGISTSKIAMANEIRDLKTANERMQQENKFMQQENKEMKNEIEILKQQVQQLMATK